MRVITSTNCVMRRNQRWKGVSHGLALAVTRDLRRRRVARRCRWIYPISKFATKAEEVGHAMITYIRADCVIDHSTHAHTGSTIHDLSRAVAPRSKPHRQLNSLSECPLRSAFDKN